MKITLCGSIAFIEKMAKVKDELEALGHEVAMPPQEHLLNDGTKISALEHYRTKKESGVEDGPIWQSVQTLMKEHFEKVAWSEAILVCNYDKRGIDNYVGPNTLIEMGLAMYLKKKVYLLNSIPEVEWKEEILGISPVVLAGDLNKIL